MKFASDRLGRRHHERDLVIPLVVLTAVRQPGRLDLSIESAAGHVRDLGRRTFRKAGGVNPTRAAGPAGRYLSWSEPEQIAALDHAGHGVREIARRLERNPSTVSRELDRGATSRGYRASVGQLRADRGRAAPRGSKLARNLPLRKEVQARLKRREIPEQIAGRLKTEFPDEPEMWVSADTIYQSLYVQARGGLRELTAYLRTGRYMRKPRRRDGKRHSRIPGMVLISERPPEVEDRAVPGHWEGDLILGWTASKSAVGT